MKRATGQRDPNSQEELSMTVLFLSDRIHMDPYTNLYEGLKLSDTPVLYNKSDFGWLPEQASIRRSVKTIFSDEYVNNFAVMNEVIAEIIGSSTILRNHHKITGCPLLQGLVEIVIALACSFKVWVFCTSGWILLLLLFMQAKGRTENSIFKQKKLTGTETIKHSLGIVFYSRWKIRLHV